MSLTGGDLLMELFTEKVWEDTPQKPNYSSDMESLGFPSMYFTFKKFLENYWSVIDLQCCISLKCTAK